MCEASLLVELELAESASVFPRAAAPAARRVRTPGLFVLASANYSGSSRAGEDDRRRSEKGASGCEGEILDAPTPSAIEADSSTLRHGVRQQSLRLDEEHDAAEPEAKRARRSRCQGVVAL